MQKGSPLRRPAVGLPIAFALAARPPSASGRYQRYQLQGLPGCRAQLVEIVGREVRALIQPRAQASARLFQPDRAAESGRRAQPVQALAQGRAVGAGLTGIEFGRQRFQLAAKQLAQRDDVVEAAQAAAGCRVVEQGGRRIVDDGLGDAAGARRDAVQRMFEGGEVKRLGQHVVETLLMQLAQQLRTGVGRRGQCRRVLRRGGRIRTQSLQCTRSVQARHMTVEQQQIEALRARQRQRAAAVAGRVAAVAELCGSLGEEAQRQCVVIGDQDMHAPSPFSSRWPQSAPSSRLPRMSVRLCLALIVVALATAAQARAAGLRAAVDTLQADGLILNNIQVELLPGVGGGQDLHLQVAQLRWPEAGLDLAELRARCPLEAGEAGWRCAGQAQLGGAQSLREAGFAATLEHGRLQLEVNRAPARLQLRQSSGETPRWQLQLRQLPLDWFDDWLRAAWPALTRVEGHLAMDVELPRGADAVTRIDYSLRDVGFDTADGRSAAAHLGLAGKLELQRATPWRLAHQGQIVGGEWLHGDLHLAFADHGTRLGFAVTPERGGYRIADLVYDDPGVLQFCGSARLAPDAAAPLLQLQLDPIALKLPQAQQRYFSSLLAGAGWAQLRSAGAVDGRLVLDAQGLVAASAQLAAVELEDAGRGLGVSGLDGGLSWERGGEAAATELGWRSATVYALPLGPTRLRWQSRDGVLGLLAPARIPLLGGTLELLRLSLHPAAASGERLQAGLAVHGVELSRLSQTLGWPRLGGQLGGAVPELRYANDRLDLAGGLLLDVFDGSLNVTGLALERPFGVLPSLSAEIAFEQLDLSLLTGTFDIGDISGRLSGEVRGLRLVDWAPVAFDAQLQALQGGRISQRAVTTISSVGGGGLAAGLQASMLKLFDTFGYARLGIGCRLHNAVCHMRGLDADGSRYTLVEGRGLPRIRIVGHQSEVDWAVLVERLKAAASGTKPVIQ